RRLVDRFGLALCAAVSAGEEVPTWVRQALPGLPELMESSDRLVGGVERAAMDAIEAATLVDRVGETFTAVVIDVPEGNGEMEIQVIDPPVMGRASGRADLGDKVTVRLTAVDPAQGKASFEVG